MIDGVLLDAVAPGPACLIPEDKKIFRVTAEANAAEASTTVAVEAADVVPAAAPLPVPHMYSA